MKVPSIYCPPRYYNILAVHILSLLPAELDEKYLTAVWQQIFVPSTGACIAFEPKRTFTEFLADTGRISVISETATPIDSIIQEKSHTPLTTYDTCPIFISLYNIVS